MSVLNKLEEYKHWRDEKLEKASGSVEDCFVSIADPFNLSYKEKEKAKELFARNNFALFQLRNQKDYIDAFIKINNQFGLFNYDKHLYSQVNGIAKITQTNSQEKADFIPYTNKQINWHTDGYYNPIKQRIRSFSLLCVNKAISGGKSAWMDHRILYILLREKNPEIAEALTHPKAMTIPEHVVDGVTRRQRSTGPIFFIDENSDQLCMRYTQRKKNVEFFNSSEIKHAVKELNEVLSANPKYHFELLFEPGQGIVCNNVIHRREEFIDSSETKRLLLRGRYFDKISL